MNKNLPNVVVTNLHKRFTGISATIFALVPEQRKLVDLAVIDKGGLGLDPTLSLFNVWKGGFSNPNQAEFRVIHTRRGVDMAIGILLRLTPGQQWRLMFTTSANKRPGRVLQYLMDQMDLIVATSQASANRVRWYSKIIPHGVDTEYFYPREPINADRHVIGYAGRVRHSKGIDLFVRSMIKLLPLWSGYEAEIAGLCQKQHQELQTQLQQEILQHNLQDRIRFIGHLERDGLRHFYQKLAICVTPSRIEGYGLVPLEAMACGTPVVTSDASSVWPIVINNKVGCIANSGDLEAFINAIESLLENPKLSLEMRQSARETVVKNHPISAEASNLVKIYQDLSNGVEFPRLYQNE